VITEINTEQAFVAGRVFSAGRLFHIASVAVVYWAL
jgi:hypothetical protein